MTRSARLQAMLAVCICLFIGLGLALLRPGLPDYPPYLSFSPDTDGSKALRVLMQREGAEVREWRLAPERLPEGEGQLYVAIEPAGMTSESAKRLTDWADTGNDVVVFQVFPGFLFDLWETEVVQPAEASVPIAVADDGGERSFDAAVGSEMRLSLKAEERDSSVELLMKDERGIVASRLRTGGGSVTLAVAPEWTVNGDILEHSQFELVWLLLDGERAAGRTVYFDEYHHGFRSAAGISHVYPQWLLIAFAQSALAVAAWLWWKGKRFGPAYTPRAFRVRHGDETLLAVAGWYRRGRLAQEALRHRVEHLKKRLAERGGLSPSADASEVLAAVQRSVGPANVPNGLSDVLRRWEQFERGMGAAYPDKAWLSDSVVLDETVKAIEEAG